LQDKPTVVFQPNPTDHQWDLSAVVSKTHGFCNRENNSGDENAS